MNTHVQRCLVGVAIAIALMAPAMGAPLDEVLRAVPASPAEWQIYFTDWAQIKENLGLEFLTSAGSLELRFEMGLRLSEDQAAASAFGLSRIRTHAEDWGWDSSDLDWEATIGSDEWPLVYLLKFSEGFDFAPIASHFIERGFTQTASLGVTVFSHELTPDTDWLRTTEFAILNTAILPEEGLLILSGSPVAVERTLSTRLGIGPSATSDALAVRTVQHLEQPETAVILRDPELCLRFLQQQISSADYDGREYDTALLEGLIPYQVFAVGYHEVDDHAVGRILLEYQDPEAARFELAARCGLAQSSWSTMSDRPISETYFTLLDCQANDGALVLTVAPIDNRPSLLLRMVYTLDAAFGACSPP